MSSVKTLLIGGAEGFLGFEACAYFAGRGLKVVASVRTDADAARVGTQLREKEVHGVRTFVCDLADDAQTGVMIARAESEVGPVDGLLNAAGAFRWGQTPDLPSADLALLWSANALTSFNLAKHLVPRMQARKAGRLVFVSSRATLEPVGAGMGAYVASKAAVNALVSALAAENKPHGLCVNAVLPTTIDTPANRQAMAGADFGAWVTIPALLGVVAVLLGAEGAVLNGALVPVGGRL